MNKRITTIVTAFLAAMCCNIASAVDNHASTSRISDACVEIPSHNLSSQQALVEAAANMPGLKTLPTLPKREASKGGIRLTPHKSAMSAPQNGSVLSESFEDCQFFSDVVPTGWTSSSQGTTPTETQDHWIGFAKNYSLLYGFATPADGDMAIGVFYNDDIYKDEWLISPEFSLSSPEMELSFYWFTVPYYIYVIDSAHVNFNTNKFIRREIAFNVEVLAKVEDGEWTKIFDLESLFSGIEYGELATISYDDMQQAIVPLNEYGGKTMQLAFRYYGKAGNTFTIDAVNVGYQASTAKYEPHFSRLFFGYEANATMSYLDEAVELYPVNAPLTWYNSSDDLSNNTFTWSYMNLDDNDNQVWNTSGEKYEFTTTYRPNYSSEQTLRNNIYNTPRLTARNANGVESAPYHSRADLMQAGGRAEYHGNVDGENIDMMLTATLFDLKSEGIGIHVEEDEQLGLYAVPIFGYDVNHDAWWEHYCFPNGKPEGQFAYVEGFANLFMPHPTAKLVVNGVTAAAKGTIKPEAQFTVDIYKMVVEDDMGVMVEPPIATKTISGADVIMEDGIANPRYMVLHFPLDEPVIFDAEGTEYGYLVKIKGYHDPANVEYFAPLQSLVPNEYGWCLGFYQMKNAGEWTLSQEMSFIRYFQDDNGNDRDASFAIGLDAEYPWLELADGEFMTAGNEVMFDLKGYYDGSQYTVSAPEGVDVMLYGRYTTNVTVTFGEAYAADSADLTFTAPGVSLTVNVPYEHASIGNVTCEEAEGSALYNTQGILLRANATESDLRVLPKGLYILGGKKVMN